MQVGLQRYHGACTGSLTNLAKYPASTVQILGAEKALFRCAGQPVLSHVPASITFYQQPRPVLNERDEIRLCWGCKGRSSVRGSFSRGVERRR